MSSEYCARTSFRTLQRQLENTIVHWYGLRRKTQSRESLKAVGVMDRNYDIRIMFSTGGAFASSTAVTCWGKLE